MKFRVGILGAGDVGVRWHVPAVREAGGEVVALADIHLELAKAAARAEAIPLALPGLEALLNCPDIDIVAVCTPPVNHLQNALDVLASGRHLYLEKPVVMDAGEARVLKTAAEQSGSFVFAGSNNLYLPEIAILREMLGEHVCGRVFAIESRKTGPGWFPVGWAARKQFAGGGVLMTSAVHRIEQTLHLFDARPCHVTAHLHSAWRGCPPLNSSPDQVPERVDSDVEDTLFALIDFDNGMTLSMRETLTPTQPLELTYQIFGDRGGLSTGPLMFHTMDRQKRTLVSEPIRVPPMDAFRHTAAYREFFDCIKRGRRPCSSPERTVRVMEIVDAIRESAAGHGTRVACHPRK